jgi:hypothetical protein
MPMYWSAGPQRLKPAAEVLAAREGTGTDSREPLIVQQFVGAGRVLFFGFDESWRWRRREDERLYNQFWMQTVRYLSKSRLGRSELRLDRQTPYRQGEPIRVTVRFPEDMPAPGPEVSVEVAVEFVPGALGNEAGPAIAGASDAELQTLRLARVEGSRATYDAVLTRSSAGSYRFRLASPAERAPVPEARARVLPPPGEMDELRMNRGDMERAALVSRGRFYLLADAHRLPGELPEMPRVALHQPRPPYRLWSHPTVFALAMGLLSFEWVLRKRRQLL